MIGPQILGCEFIQIWINLENLLLARKLWSPTKHELIKALGSLLELDVHGWTEAVVFPIVVVSYLDEICAGFGGAHRWLNFAVSHKLFRCRLWERRTSKLNVLEFS